MYALELNRNIGGVETTGVDLQVNWGAKAGPGRLGANWYLTYVDEWLATEPDGRQVDYAGTIGSRGLGGALPRTRSLLYLRYDWPVFGVYARWQHIDGMRVAEYRDFRVPAYDYFDAGVTVALDQGSLAGLSAIVGIENLFNEDPPLFPSYPQANTDPSQYERARPPLLPGNGLPLLTGDSSISRAPPKSAFLTHQNPRSKFRAPTQCKNRTTPCT